MVYIILFFSFFPSLPPPPFFIEQEERIYDLSGGEFIIRRVHDCQLGWKEGREAGKSCAAAKQNWSRLVSWSISHEALRAASPVISPYLRTGSIHGSSSCLPCGYLCERGEPFDDSLCVWRAAINNEPLLAWVSVHDPRWKKEREEYTRGEVYSRCVLHCCDRCAKRRWG